MTSQHRRRAGFTLIEMLVVIGIIGLLMALTASAVFRYRQNSMEKNTNTHLLKIHEGLVRQWSAAVDRIKKEDPPQIIKEMTKNADGTSDPVRAKAMHLKLRLRQEFPENFGEVFTTIGPLTFAGQSYTYDKKAAFLTAIKDPLQAGPNQLVDPVPEGQAAAMLVLILSQGQGGSTTNPESIAPTRLQEFPQNPKNGVQPPPVQLRVFVDEWGTPISFRRLADDDMPDVLAELNQPPYASPAQTQSGNMDPQDPEGRLKITTWPGRAQLMPFLASNTQGSRPFVPNPFDGRNRGPFAFSAGKNKMFYVPNSNPPVMEQDLDNLYSYRLAETGKGN